jgi:hypothetical protein
MVNDDKNKREWAQDWLRGEFANKKWAESARRA